MAGESINYSNRVSLASKQGVRDPMFNSPILDPLKQFGGILFPYMPDIQYDVRAIYDPLALTHTNYSPNIYKRTENPRISLNSIKFTASTVDDGLYMIAVMHYLRTITKMHFGVTDAKRGSPPPVLNFSAYGPTNFENVPVQVISVNYRYPSDVDYVPIKTPIGTSMVPMVLEMTMDLSVQYSTNAIKNKFNLSDFANGTLAKQGYI